VDPILFECGADAAGALHTANGALASIGYAITPGADGWSARAEVGSAAGRLVGGGFVRRMIVDVQVTQGSQPGTSRVVVTPAMSGWSGGALGVSKAKKEMQNIHSTVGQALHQAGLLAS